MSCVQNLISGYLPQPSRRSAKGKPFFIRTKVGSGSFPQIKNSKFDYLVTSSDGIAQGVAQCLDKKGVAIPGDLKILGFDKIDSIDFLKFPASTIEVPVNEMIDKLINLMDSTVIETHDHVCMTKLHLIG